MFAQFKIGHRLTAIVAPLFIFIAIVFTLGLNGMSESNERLRRVYEGPVLKIVHLNTALSNLARIRYMGLLITAVDKDDPLATGVDKRLAGYRTDFKAHWDAYVSKINDPEEQKIADRLAAMLVNYDRLIDDGIRLAKAGETEEAAHLATHQNRDLYGLLSKDFDALVAEQEQDAATRYEHAGQSYQQNRIVNVAVVIAAFLIGGILTFVISRSIVRPIRGLTQVMANLAEGQYQTEIPFTAGTNEIAQMARSVLVFKEHGIRAEQLAAEQRHEQASREARGKALENLTGQFDLSVSGVLETVSNAAAEMEATAQSMAATAEQTNRQATVVLSATQGASSSVQTVASAAEELAASIHEIGRQVEQSSTLSRSAVDEASHTNTTVRGLAESSARIGEVVNLINDIASQTNLLALNATIEAARAGDAGKGFAVVAGEVKNLANQTGRATEEISAQISAVQGATQEAVTAIGAIVARIEQINEIAAAISAAVEQQSAATSEIARNVQQAAQGTQEVSSTIGGVTDAAGETGSAAEQVLVSAQSLSREATRLRGVVSTFLQGVRTI